MSFADPIEEQQSPGGSVTRVSGAKGGKKSLRSKVSFLQPRRLSQESKKDHATEREVCTCLCKDAVCCVVIVQRCPFPMLQTCWTKAVAPFSSPAV